MLNVTVCTELGVEVSNYESRDEADIALLDLLRGHLSCGHKAFAFVKGEDAFEFVVIDGNCTQWLSVLEFVNKVNIPNSLG